MGISRYLGDAFSIPNLFRNGGLDFQDDVSDLPPFYSITGAEKDAPITANSWGQVFGEVPTTQGGLANYFRLLLPKLEPVTLVNDFSNANATFDYATPIESSELQPHNYLAIESNLLYQGKFTISFSVRVPQGAISLGISYQLSSTEDVEPEYMELDPIFSNTRWKRYSGVIDVGAGKLILTGVQVQRKGSAQAVEVHIGNIMLAAGAYDDLPYTGDPAAMVFPRGAIVMTLGLTCPPGFVPVEFDEVYPREGEPGQTGGSLKHEHDLEQKMFPEEAWPKRSLLDSDDAGGITNLQAWPASKGDPALEHDHPIIDDSGQNNTEPAYRGYRFCRRV